MSEGDSAAQDDDMSIFVALAFVFIGSMIFYVFEQKFAQKTAQGENGDDDDHSARQPDMRRKLERPVDANRTFTYEQLRKYDGDSLFLVCVSLAFRCMM